MTAPGTTAEQPPSVAYRVHVRHEEFQFENVVHATQVDREDGWTVFWQGDDVFLRLRDEHLVHLEMLV